jgi:hypothetical protein
MVGNEKQKLCLLEGNGDYVGYADNSYIQELLQDGWVITQITGASMQSTKYCYVLLENTSNEQEIAK